MRLSTPQQVMPACFFPTSIAAVDDNVPYLDNIVSFLSPHFFVKPFSDPKASLQYINHERIQTNFADRCLQKIPNPTFQGKDFRLNPSAIMNEIYNPNRYKECYVALVDYAMAAQNGLELCSQIEAVNFDTIMLTGEAQYELAGEAFQKGLIRQFLRKDDPEVETKVFRLIQMNQHKVFEMLSYTVVSLLPHPDNELHSLFDPKVIAFLQKHITDNQICEYYLADPFGSYLMLDRDANSRWMLLRTEKAMDQAIALAHQLNAPKTVIQSIENKEKLLSFTSLQDVKNGEMDWNHYLYPALTFEGDRTYYYAEAKKLRECPIDRSKILSYNQFLQSTL